MFNINNGDNLILFGDIKKGIAIAKYDDYVSFMDNIFEEKNKYNRKYLKSSFGFTADKETSNLLLGNRGIDWSIRCYLEI